MGNPNPGYGVDMNVGDSTTIAWGHFDGTLADPSSTFFGEGISGIIDNGTGDWSPVFEKGQPTNGYAAIVTDELATGAQNNTSVPNAGRLPNKFQIRYIKLGVASDATFQFSVSGVIQ